MKRSLLAVSMEDNILARIFDWLIIILGGGVMFLFRKLFKHDDILSSHETSMQLLIQAQEQCDKVRDEDVQRNEKAHKQLMEALNTHHSTVMGRLDVLAGKHQD